MLDRKDQRDVCILASLLRVGDALDRTHRSVVREINCCVHDDRILIRCRTSQPAEYEQAKALLKADLMQATFKRRVEVDWRLL